MRLYGNKWAASLFGLIKEERTEYSKYANYDDFVSQMSGIGANLAGSDRIEVVKYAAFRMKSR